MPPTPFLIGVDLGTTNSVVAAVDTRRRNPRAEVFRIPQLVAPGVVEPWPVLPSFVYFPEPEEIAGGGITLPWDLNPSAIVGVLARDRGALAPARHVASAKSWLTHPGVDRHAPFLPWGSTVSSPRVSPVDASARFLMHLREAWNATIASGDEAAAFERQSIVLTVPASFDEEARELTVEAARVAQLSTLTLLEEPIAAFYAWMAEQRRAIALEDEEIALVCDVGGGTTDFSLIRVRIEAGAPSFERVAIGDHLLLGGDNVDLALATIVERRIAAVRPTMRLAITQRLSLRRLCSAAKERMLGEATADRVPITVLGVGRSLIGDSITLDLTRDEVEAALNEFLPLTRADEESGGRDRRAGLRELGLPYETDPAITRHLAAFLARSAAVLAPDHRAVVMTAGRRMIRPDLVLFNGGFFTPAVARERVAQALAGWFGETPRLLATGNLEAAVAVGAATYARLRAGIGRTGVLVKAGSGRAYYIALGAPRGAGAIAAVCVLARGTEEGTEHTFDHPFSVVTNRPVSFLLYSSTTRPDRAGDIVSLDPEVDAREHAPLVTVFRFGRKSRHVELPVRLSVAFTEVGTLDVWCRSETTEHRWRLQFQVRSAAEEMDGAEGATSKDESSEVVIAHEAIGAAGALIRSLFERTSGDVTPEDIVAQIEKDFGYAKSAWPLGVIRQLADALLEVADGRRQSAPLEARWLNLFGFCIRPGFGAAKDPWRITEARRVYTTGVSFASSIQNRVEWLVLWQRASGGFTAGQQRELAQRVMADLGLAGAKAKKPNPQVERESWRLLASLERLDAATRVKIGDGVMRRLRRDGGDMSLLWSIGRLGARTPIYGPLTSVVAPSDAGRWLEELVANERSTPERFAAIVQIGALTDDSLRDLDEIVLNAARQHLRDAGVDPDQARPLYEIVTATFADTSRAFGEPLPNGLRLGDDASSGESAS
jgi:DNA-K related protein/Hsp70 protein